MRLNPRHRWEEDRTSNIAGVPALILVEFSTLAYSQIMGVPDRAHRRTLAEINGAVVRGVAEIIAEKKTDWLELGQIRMRRGRGDEMTIIAKNYSHFRSWLTEVTLALYDRYPQPAGFSAWSAHDRKLKLVLDMLEKSPDRRDNTWDYRDKSYREIRALSWWKSAFRQRREAIDSDIRFRRNMDHMFAEMAAERAKS